MGFGIALIGYAFLLMADLGGAVLAAPLLAYGFFLASRLESNFLRASVASLLLLPRGVFMVIGFFIDTSNNPHINIINACNIVTYIIYQIGWLFMTCFWLLAVMNIARECQAPKMLRRAKSVLTVTVPYILFATVTAILDLGGFLGNYAGTVSVVIFILMYAVIIYNIAMLHTCFVLITSEKQYEKDKQQLAKERAEAIKKANEKQQEAARRIEQRKNNK